MSEQQGPTGVWLEVELWNTIKKTTTKPWPLALAQLDLAFIEQEYGALLSRAQLMERWGLSERKVRTVLTRYKKKRPGPNTKASSIAPAKPVQVVGITSVDTATPSSPVIKSVPKCPDVFQEPINKIFSYWEDLQYQRTGRHNKLTKGRSRVLRSALEAGHSESDLSLVVRMAFEYPEGDFLVDGWRSGGYMDIANLLNREKVDRNVTLAAERWTGTEWSFTKPKVIRFDAKYLKLWEDLEFLLGAYGSEPESLHKNPRVSQAMSQAVRAVGGWKMLGTLRPGRDTEKIRQDFLSEVRGNIARLQQQTKRRGV
jgi:hypothetical protein